MKPYYSHAGITIYHGDCREILPLCDVDAIISDPPYGMGYKPLRGSDGSKLFTDGVIGDTAEFDPQHLLRFRVLVLFGANWYADKLPARGGWIVWDKTPLGHKDGFFASHAELAWTNEDAAIVKFSMQWGGEAHGEEEHFHPTQKPVALMDWIIRKFTCGHEIIADPYMGSGPVLLAAKKLQRRAIGIEIEEKYCEIAAKRLSQEVFQF